MKSGNYAIGNEGDQILTKKQTDNIHEWSKTNPDEYAQNQGGRLSEEQRKRFIEYAESVGGGIDKNGNIVFSKLKDEDKKPEYTKVDAVTLSTGQKVSIDAFRDVFFGQNMQQISPTSLVKQPEMVPNNVKNNNVNVHYGSLITINGDVNDGDRIIKQMEKVTTRAIEKSWHDCDLNRKYGIY
ncbi:MAG: hypothetical protein HDR24_12860 [Lachnospiraceae bacterium]|nr:hypothetical protein [Lachnospiraceae bacterium]